jgi:hypothetical protein
VHNRGRANLNPTALRQPRTPKNAVTHPPSPKSLFLSSEISYKPSIINDISNP